jgi:hypothetical protein
VSSKEVVIGSLHGPSKCGSACYRRLAPAVWLASGLSWPDQAVAGPDLCSGKVSSKSAATVSITMSLLLTSTCRQLLNYHIYISIYLKSCVVYI